MLKLVLFCGGSGSASLVKELSNQKDIQTTLIINPFDDGKSTGLLRKKIKGLPGISDFRKNIVNSSRWKIAKLLNRRVYDMAIGNVLMASIYLITKDFQKSVDWAARIFGSKVRLLSITNAPATLSALTEDGNILETEADISNYEGTSKITSLIVDGLTDINKDCVEALIGADIVVYGAGTPHSSLLPTYMVLSSVLDIKKVSATKVLVENLELENDTKGWGREEVINATAKYWKAPLNLVVDKVIYATPEGHKGGILLEKILQADASR